MRGLLLFLIGAMLLTCTEPTSDETEQNTPTTHPTVVENSYDSTYAKRLNADDYGMHKYVLVLLKKGPNRNQDSTEAARLQRAHLDNMSKWADDGLLVVAGPTYNHSSALQGLYVFALENVEEVERLAAADPAIQAGRLIMESYPWYSSAALMDVNRIHELISKEKI